MATPRPETSRHPLQYFPRLGPDNHRITSPVSRAYNCVAWAAGIENQHLWPSGAEDLMTEPEVSWPKGIRSDESIEAFVEFFESIGYRLCNGPESEDGYLKLSIFVKDEYPTHTCRQLPSQKWTSKMGFDGVDIEHDNLDCLEGDQYGTAAVFMKRPTSPEP